MIVDSTNASISIASWGIVDVEYYPTRTADDDDYKKSFHVICTTHGVIISTPIDAHFLEVVAENFQYSRKTPHPFEEIMIPLPILIKDHSVTAKVWKKGHKHDAIRVQCEKVDV